MIDKELLELAAKAAGMVWSNSESIAHDGLWITKPNIQTYWNPLTDDGDALRLAVKLKMTIDVDLWSDKVQVRAYSAPSMYHIDDDGDQPNATRRAIVRAAAEIGRTIGETK